MSRHRNIRSMRYSDEYDGFDDVYGHSVEEDYAMSPSDAAFMYDRTNQTHQLCNLIRSEEDIAEEDEAFADDRVQKKLNNVENAKLMSCLDGIRNILGDAFPEQDLTDAALSSDYNVSLAVDKLLNHSDKQKEKVAESPKPQRNNIRSRRIGAWSPNTLRIVEFLVQNRKKCDSSDAPTNFQEEPFDVIKFLEPNKNVRVNLYEAVILRGTELNYIRPEKEEDTADEIMTHDIQPFNGESKKNKSTETLFPLKNMPIELLERSRPSKIGFCVCNKIIESKALNKFKKSNIYNSEIIPFKFDCMSPDDVSSINTTWRHYN